MANSFNGIGTTFYGQSDFDDEGSFITTKWFILCFFPLIPMSSIRVQYAEPEGFFGSGTSYHVLEELPLNLIQVLKTWAYVIAMFVLFGTLLANEKVAPAVQVTGLVLGAALPTILRFFAKRAAQSGPSQPAARAHVQRQAAPAPAILKIATCPKCAYTRKPDDYAPDWQCPSCKVAYNKVAQSGKTAA